MDGKDSAAYDDFQSATGWSDTDITNFYDSTIEGSFGQALQNETTFNAV